MDLWCLLMEKNYLVEEKTFFFSFDGENYILQIDKI